MRNLGFSAGLGLAPLICSNNQLEKPQDDLTESMQFIGKKVPFMTMNNKNLITEAQGGNCNWAAHYGIETFLHRLSSSRGHGSHRPENICRGKKFFLLECFGVLA